MRIIIGRGYKEIEISIGNEPPPRGFPWVSLFLKAPGFGEVAVNAIDRWCWTSWREVKELHRKWSHINGH